MSLPEQRVFELPLRRWNKVVDWLERQESRDAKSVVDYLVRSLNKNIGTEDWGREPIMTLIAFVGDPLDVQVSAAIAATGGGKSWTL